MGTVQPATSRLERWDRLASALCPFAMLLILAGLWLGGPWRLAAVAGAASLAATLLLKAKRLTRLERNLRAAEADFERMVELPAQVRWTGDADGNFLSISDRWTDWTGLTLEQSRNGEWLKILHPDDRERIAADWTVAQASEAPFAAEFRCRMQDGDYRWLRSEATPHRDEQDQLAGWVGLTADIHDQRLAQSNLVQTAGLLEMISNSTDSFIYVKDVEGRMLYANRAVERAAGVSLPDMLGKTDAEWSGNSAEAEAFAKADRAVLDSGKPQDVEEAFTNHDGSVHYYHSLKNPLYDASGKVIGIVGISTDITDKREAEERIALLGQELDHRAKNLLAVVQSVIALTRAGDIDEFRTAAIGRIEALSRAHSMLSASRWEGADLQRIIAEELDPYDDKGEGRVRVGGPSVLLKPTAAQSLSLVIHELATNAAKYGALSRDSGTLDVSWDVTTSSEGPASLHLSWHEEGGPAPRSATSRASSGFGSRLIRNSIERQLGGRILYDWAQTGLSARLEVPLLVAPIPEDASAEPTSAPTLRARA